jgi:hypothetical protein
MKTSKWKIYLIVGAVVVGGYAIYAKFIMGKTPIGGLCSSGAMCPGQCLGFGDLLPDYSHQEVCTQTCGGPSDCPTKTSCQPVQLTTTDGKSVKTEEKRFCLPEQPLASVSAQGGAQ